MKNVTALKAVCANQALYKEMLGLLQAMELIQGPGELIFVSSVKGRAAGSGTKDDPVNTIQEAMNKCIANRGDRIVCLPGHAETVSAAAGLDLDIAGLSILGMGNGTLKPTITLGTATTADVDIDAANMYLGGFRFISNIDSLANILDVNAANFLCEDCDFISSSTKECVCFIDLATTVDEFTFNRCRFFQPTDPEGTDDAAATGCFYFVDSEGIYINDCFFYGNFETSIFHNKTTAAKNVIVRNCFGTQLLATGLIYTQVAAMEGANLNCTWNHRLAADVTEATWTGTVSANFVFDVNSSVLADGAAGGQYGAPGTAANS